MKASGWAVSALVTWHLAAISCAAFPPADRFTDARARLLPNPGGAPRSAAAQAIDGGLRALLPALRAAAHVADWTRPVFRRYHSLTGTWQNWSMFGDPPRSDRYMRVRYYVRPERGARVWMATELIWPAHREDRVRLLQSFQDSFRDKALDISLDRFREHRDASLIQPSTRSDQLPDDLAPAARYFARRFSRSQSLAARGESIVRIEVWVGTARNHPPGESPDPTVYAARIAALQFYYEGPVEQRFGVPRYPPYHGAEREADIEWVLEYFEEP